MATGAAGAPAYFGSSTITSSRTTMRSPKGCSAFPNMRQCPGLPPAGYVLMANRKVEADRLASTELESGSVVASRNIDGSLEATACDSREQAVPAAASDGSLAGSTPAGTEPGPAIDSVDCAATASATTPGGAIREADVDDTNLPATIGRFRVKSLLGRGAFGFVLLGQDDELDRLVAIKVPRPERVKTPDDIQAYLEEARFVASLDHKGIVPVFDVGRSPDGLCFVVSKYIQGSSLAQRMTERPCPTRKRRD